jgi:hypothetical protein
MGPSGSDGERIGGFGSGVEEVAGVVVGEGADEIADEWGNCDMVATACVRSSEFPSYDEAIRRILLKPVHY